MSGRRSLDLLDLKARRARGCPLQFLHGVARGVGSAGSAKVRVCAVRHGVTVLNAPGTIDADYRGEVMVPLINLGDEPFVVTRGERIAQLVIAPVHQVVWTPVTTLDDTERGTGGFGSTGRN